MKMVRSFTGQAHTLPLYTELHTRARWGLTSRKVSVSGWEHCNLQLSKATFSPEGY